MPLPSEGEKKRKINKERMKCSLGEGIRMGGGAELEKGIRGSAGRENSTRGKECESYCDYEGKA